MKSFIAVVRFNSDNNITKYLDFDTLAEAQTHVDTYGGFATSIPTSGVLRHWIIDSDAETLTYNSDTADSEAETAAWAAIRTKRNSLLQATDFALLNGSIYYTAQKDLWKAWRTELRDLPENITDPTAFSLDSDFSDPPFDIL